MSKTYGSERQGPLKYRARQRLFGAWKLWTNICRGSIPCQILRHRREATRLDLEPTIVKEVELETLLPSSWGGFKTDFLRIRADLQARRKKCQNVISDLITYHVVHAQTTRRSFFNDFLDGLLAIWEQIESKRFGLSLNFFQQVVQVGVLYQIHHGTENLFLANRTVFGRIFNDRGFDLKFVGYISKYFLLWVAMFYLRSGFVCRPCHRKWFFDLPIILQRDLRVVR